jgi:excisionase family DNA binding protein
MNIVVQSSLLARARSSHYRQIGVYRSNRLVILDLLHKSKIPQSKILSSKIQNEKASILKTFARGLLTQIVQGNVIALIPIHTELTTQEAAEILNVSRSYLIKLLEAGEIPYHKVRRHRRISFKDLTSYKEQIDNARMKTLDELAAQAQDLNMGYD